MAQKITKNQIETQQSWQTTSLGNSWVNYGSGLPDSAYMKDSLGFVHIRGLIKSGTIGSAAFTLPTGYRPGGSMSVPAVSNSLFGVLQINADGTVIPLSGSNVFFYLDNVTFRAEG